MHTSKPNSASRAVVISQRHLRKRLFVTMAVLLIPLLVASATSIAFQKSAMVHSRYLITIGQLLEGIAKLKGQVALFETGRQSDLSEARSTYVDVLELYTALRAADPDGEGTLDPSEEKNRQLLSNRIIEAGINPVQVSRKLGLFGREMPSALIDVWEEEEDWGEVDSEEISIEKSVGMILLTVADFLKEDASKESSLEQFWSAYENLPNDKLLETTLLLNETARTLGQGPVFLTLLVVAVVLFAAIFAWVIVARPLIDEILKMQKRLEDEAKAARVSDMAKTQFLATISHELRTPMNGVIGAAQLLELADLPEEDKELIEILNSCAANQMDLIEEILTFGEIEAGALDIREEPIDVTDLIKNATSFATVLARKKGLSLEILVSQDAPPIMGDEKRLKQIVVNLLGNAIKFTTEGTVKVEAVVEQLEDAQNGIFRVSVADTGEGIAIEDQEKIFDRFTQVDNSSTRTSGGTGLGLSIAQGIAHKAKGKITLESQLGVGSTFTLEIPTKILSAAAAETQELSGAA